MTGMHLAKSGFSSRRVLWQADRMSKISVANLSKTFGDQAVVNGISFDVEEGSLAVLLGPSGCGKSTTLRLIAGLEEPSAGSITIAGRDVAGLAPAARGLAMVFQSYALFPHLDVAENIVFGLRVRGVGRAERGERLRKVADLVGLGPYLARKPGQLSGGQRQRVALARAIIAEQRLCLMDEPLSNLDARLRHEMRVEIRALQQRLGMTMVYVTHDQTEAMTMADRVILLRDGRIEQNGRPDELYERPASVFAARFIGAPPMNIIDAGAGDGLIGVRAEHIRIRGAGESGHAARVAAIEYLGADTMVTAQMGENRVTARLQGRFGAGDGEPVVLDWEKVHEHRFDAKTEQRLEI